MSMVLTRSPLEPIGMNGAGVSKRRSARLSAEGAEDNNEPPAKKSKTTMVGTKTGDGNGSNGTAVAGPAKRKKRVYEEEDDDFAFSKSKKTKAKPAPAVRNSDTRNKSPQPDTEPQKAAPVPAEDIAPRTAQKKNRRRLPSTPERDAADKTVRRSKRISTEHEPTDNHVSPHKPAHARSHAKQERSPSPEKARPLTVEKKRKRGVDGVEEEKVTRIQLPFADTPVIKRNKEMRKASAENGSRRSSSGMRGRRASSLIDEGRGNGEYAAISSGAEASRFRTREALSTGSSETRVTVVSRPVSRSGLAGRRPGLSTPPSSNELEETATLKGTLPESKAPANESICESALPHSEVPAAEFYKHISADLTEPRRMRCLLGWCGTRTLPPRPEPPKDKTAASNAEFQASQSARVIQVELSQDLITKGILSDWFSRDDDAPPRVPLRKKPNPRNVANAAKAEELERELERLKKERGEWDELIAAAAQAIPAEDADPEGGLSPLHPELLDSPQRAILEQLHAPAAASTAPEVIRQRIGNISDNLEFTIDQYAHGVHALKTAKETAERLADRSLGDAANVLEEREKDRKVNGKSVDTMDALRGLARVLNSQKR